MGFRFVSLRLTPVDKSWQHGWSKAAHRLMHLMSSVIYHKDFDSVLKQCMKTAKGAKACMEYGVSAFMVFVFDVI
jgi:mevalonate pyrophosphate decarboxylase